MARSLPVPPPPDPSASASQVILCTRARRHRGRARQISLFLRARHCPDRLHHPLSSPRHIVRQPEALSMSPELLLSTILPRSSQDAPCALVAACALSATLLLRRSHVLVVISSVVVTESTQGSIATTLSPDIVDRREVTSVGFSHFL